MTLRVPYVDEAWARDLISYLRQQYDEQLATPGRSEFDLASLASRCLTMAGLEYALDRPLADARGWMERALPHLETLLCGDGTAVHFPVHVVAEDGHVTTQAQPDSSLRNSKRGAVAICVAAIVAPDDRLLRIAGAVADSPGAAYLGHRSEVCTFGEQHFAYALRHLVRGERAGFAEELLAASRSVDDVPSLRAVLASLEAREPARLVEGLHAYLAHHAAFAEQDPRDPKGYLSHWALGCSALALRQGWLRAGDLPDQMHHPAGLVAP